MATKKITEEEARAMRGPTKPYQTKMMTDEQIKLAAMTDKTARLFLPFELQQFKHKRIFK